MTTTFKQLINPHSHSDSSLDGAATVDQIIKRNKDLGATHVTLTEHGHLCSAMELYTLSKKAKMKPILGIEAYLVNPFHDEIVEVYRKAHAEGRITLRSKKEDTIENELQRKAMNHYLHVTIHFRDEWAYKYFCGLSKAMWDRSVKKYDEVKPMITLDELKGAAGHITIGSSCMRGPAQYFLLPSRDGIIRPNPERAEYMFNVLREIAGDGFFAEIFPHGVTHEWVRPQKAGDDGIFQSGYFKPNECTCDFPDGDMQKPLNQFVWSMAEKYKVPALISLDSHFAKPEQKLIQNSRLGNGMDAWQFHQSYHIMTTEEAAIHLRASLGLNDQQIEGMVDNSYQWASLFDNFKIPTSDDRWIMDGNSEAFLARLKETIDKWGRMDYSNPEMMERLKKEIQVLAYNGKINLLAYFATVEDMANYCRENGILMNVRGSAGGSLLLYLIGVSSVNPLKHDLSFERFLTEGRIKANALPDADLDVSDQEGLIKYLNQKYGDNVCRLSIDMLLRIKTSIKDAERSILGKVRPETEVLTKKLPSTPMGTNDHDFVFGKMGKDGVFVPGLLETSPVLKKYAEDNPILWASISEMLGIQRNKSTHPCGFVITDKPVTDYMPIIKINEEWATGYSPKYVEAAGGVKFDILGLNTLRDIQLCLKSIEERTGTKLDPFNLPYDEKCFVELGLGHNEGVFQLDTPTVRPYTIAIKPTSIDGITAITSLCRPGTLDAPSGRKDGNGVPLTLAEVYVQCAQGLMPIEHIHPDMAPITGETFGIQLYQEQSLRIFRDIGGFTYEEAEMVRRGIGKKDEKVLRDSTLALRVNAIKRGWTDAQVDLLIEQIMASAKYSFNKSHATSYAYVAYACIFFRVNYPLDWWKAILSNASKDEVASKFWKYVKDFTLLPDINQSASGFIIKGDKLVAPLSILHGVGEKAYEQLIANAPYPSLEEFCQIHLTKKSAKTRSALNIGVARKLVAAGILDSLFPPDSITVDKMAILEQVRAKVRNEKIEAVPEEYSIISSLGQYLIKKQLIGVHSADLRDLILANRGGERRPFNGREDVGLWFTQDNRVVLDGPQIEWIKTACQLDEQWKVFHLIDKLIPKDKQPFEQEKDDGVSFCAVGYVIHEKVFPYKGKSKQATNLVIDVNGFFDEEMLWPAYGTNVAPSGFKDLPVLVHYRADNRGFRVTKLLPYLTKEEIKRYSNE